MNEQQKQHESEAEKIIELEEEILEELIDLEEWVKAGKKPCKAKSYRSHFYLRRGHIDWCREYSTSARVQT